MLQCAGGSGPGRVVRVNGEYRIEGFAEDLAGLTEAIPVLQKRLSLAVQAEQAHERRAIQRLYANTSVRQLQRDGIVLLQLSAKRDSDLFRQIVWRFYTKQSQELPYHRRVEKPA